MIVTNKESQQINNCTLQISTTVNKLFIQFENYNFTVMLPTISEAKSQRVTIQKSD